MTLTEKQTKQAQDLIKQYGFCTLETQKELAKAGFFEKQVVMHYIVFLDNVPETLPQSTFVATQGDIDFYAENDYHFIFMPQMGEVWKQLPPVLYSDYSLCHIKYSAGGNGISYSKNGYVWNNGDSSNNLKISNENSCEAACLMWLRLHKEGLP